MRAPSTVLLALLAAAPLAAPLAAQRVVLDQEFDSGSLDVAGSTVDLSDPARPLVTLEPRRFPGPWGGDHWWVSFVVRGVAGRTPRLRIPTAGAFQGYSSAQRWVWSATPDDETSWRFFDQGTVSGGYYSLGNADPFVDDEVAIAYGIPYPFARTAAHTAGLVGQADVAPTASADASFVLGASAGTAGGGYVDDLGRAVPSLPLFGYRITDAATPGPKRRIVVTAGNHSGEATGCWTLQGFVDFLLGPDPEAVALRKLAETYVYPQSDPEGRYSGYFRSNPENPTKNHNRYWDDPVGFTELTALTSAMQADSGADVDLFLDFHSFGSPTGLGYYLHSQNAETAVFLAELLALEPSLSDLGTVGNPTPGIAAAWAASSAGLGATVAMTPEAGYLANQPVGRYLLLGEHYARAALRAFLAAPSPFRPPGRLGFRRRVRALAPALWLGLDEISGATVHDASGGGHDGSLVGAVGLGAPDPFVEGSGGAVKFGGAASGSPYVVVPDFPVAGPANGLTLAFWFRTLDVSGAGLQYLFSHGTVATPESLNVYIVEPGHPSGQGDRLRTVFLDADDPAGYGDVLDVLPAPADGAWHFYALTVSGAEGATVYLDGVERVRDAAIGGAAFDPSTDLFLATREDLDPDRSYGGPGPDDGFLDEVLLFDHALDAATVAALASASPPPTAHAPAPSASPGR